MKNKIKEQELKTLIKLTNFKHNQNEIYTKQDIINAYRKTNMNNIYDKTNHSNERFFKINKNFTYEYTYERFDGYLSFII